MSIPDEMKALLHTVKPTVSKKQRAEVYAKSEGVCWYCGYDLPDRWHVDHVEPLIRSYDGSICSSTLHLHHVDNMVPACPSCNILKSSCGLEQFRRKVENLVNCIREYSVKFRNAERFNMVEDMRDPAIFWFEHNNKETRR